MKPEERDISPFTGIALGLIPGLAIPVAAGFVSSALVRMLLVTVPISIIIVWLTRLWLGSRARCSGRDPTEADNDAQHVLEPLYLTAVCPVGALLNLPGLSIFILFTILCAVMYRFSGFILRDRDECDRSRAEIGIICLAFLIGLLFLFQVNLSHDAFQYYGYLASTVLDGDLNMFNNIYVQNVHRSYNPFPETSARYMGTSVFQAAPFLVGHAAAHLLNMAGQFNMTDGYGTPYYFCVNLCSSLFGLAGIVLCYRIVRRFFSARVSLVALISVWWCSPLLFFMYVWNSWSHTFSFFLVSLFLYVWLGSRGKRTARDWLLLGIAGGGIALTRPSDLVVGLIPLVEFIAELRLKKPAVIWTWIAGGLLAATAALMVFSPQISMWKIMSGNWLAAPYKEVGDFFDWFHPNIGGILFSLDQHGLFAWSPLLLGSAAGLVLLWKKDRLLMAGAILMFVTATYYYSCWSIWWSGAGFSNRFFISLTPIFILGTAAVVERLCRKIRLEVIWGIMSLFVIWNIMLMGEYVTELIPVGIPDPAREGIESLTFARILDLHMRVFPRDLLSPVMGEWHSMGFFTGRLIGAVRFSNWLGVAGTGLLALLCIGMACLTCATVMKYRSRRLVIAVVILVITLHAVLWKASGRTSPMAPFYRFERSRIHACAGMEDEYVYCDYPRLVSRLDVISSLAYSQAIPNGSEVCEVTVFDEDGNEYGYTLRAGIDVADASVLRPETLETIQHGIGTAEAVRSYPRWIYSGHVYDTLLFHSDIAFPQPIVVRKLRFRYLHPQGRLLLSDLFLRESS